MMNVDVLRHLRCPNCDRPLHRSGAAGAQTLRCPDGHSFDVARQGYVNLLTGRVGHSGDSPEMVAAREEFLSAGHYDFISAALASTAARVVTRAGTPPFVVDVGAGTGRHLATMLNALPGATGLAVDIAKPAIRRAARAHPRIGAVLGDTWTRLPVADAVTAVLINVFAPRNGPEFRRILRPDGRLLVVTPDTAHLTELVDRLSLLRVDPEKAGRIAQRLTGEFTQVDETEHRRQMRLSRRAVWALVSMGPSAWHQDPARLAERIAGLPEPVAVTAAVRLTTYRPLGG